MTGHRILWNERDKDIDEVVIDHPAMVHIEQIDERCWWIAIYLDDDSSQGRYWMGNFRADSRGRMRFEEQDNNGVEWEQDEEHERSWKA